jgi:hypothetical protein
MCVPHLFLRDARADQTRLVQGAVPRAAHRRPPQHPRPAIRSQRLALRRPRQQDLPPSRHALPVPHPRLAHHIQGASIGLSYLHCWLELTHAVVGRHLSTTHVPPSSRARSLRATLGMSQKQVSSCLPPVPFASFFFPLALFPLPSWSLPRGSFQRQAGHSAGLVLILVIPFPYLVFGDFDFASTLIRTNVVPIPTSSKHTRANLP